MSDGVVLDAIVVGAGPAGAAAALGLAGLGYRVRLISSTRAPTVEGLSARALASLARAGLRVDCETLLCPRHVSWAGDVSARGQECVVLRDRLDAGLLRSVLDEGIAFTAATVSGIRHFDPARSADDAAGGEWCGDTAGAAWRVDTDLGTFLARTVIDARGRRARRSEIQGPKLVAWNQLLQSDNAPARPRCGREDAAASAVVALEDGWCWLARTGGTISLQFVCSAYGRMDRREVSSRFASCAADAPGFLPLESPGALLESRWTARAAVARYTRPCRQRGLIRIGDAAVAMDPLSGNGVHEAVRSATVAVAAVNSFLQGVGWEIVARFVDERAWELWRRSVAAAGRFYRVQAEHGGGPFWTGTASEYERLAREATVRHEGSARFEERPVLDGERIDLRRVWVSAEWPRGVWKVGGQSLDEIPPDRIPAILSRAAGGLSREVSDDR